MRYLIVWADYGSSGLKDEFGGWLDPEQLLGASPVNGRLRSWVARYQDESERPSRQEDLERLDSEGLAIAAEIVDALNGEAKVKYFSERLERLIPVTL